MLTVINSCYRHDFGYRNFKAQNRFEANKARIDDNFKTDMFNQCANESAKGPCEATATLYYEAVKAFGRNNISDTRAEVRTHDAIVYFLVFSDKLKDSKSVWFSVCW